MFSRSTDREWERFGKHDAYYGVLNQDKFRKAHLDEAKEEFLKSGFPYIENVLANIKKHIDQDFKIDRAVDFGCGVGRLVVPLAKVAKEVIAIDVSTAMLLEARKNCEARSISNVKFVKSDDNLSCLDQRYSFIHSIIVFQHIPVHRGELIFNHLLSRLEPGGVCVVHFTYASKNKRKQLASLIRKWIPLGANLINLIQGRDFFAPHMQMNEYNLNRLFLGIQDIQVANCYTEFTDHGGELGMILYFQKPRTTTE